MNLLFIALSAISLARMATSLPRSGPSNVPANVVVDPVPPSTLFSEKLQVFNASSPLAGGLAGEPSSHLKNKRATLVVDIWQDSNRGGRHEGLISETQKCYNLYNGWNDEISSLSVPNGFGCIFYQDSNCNPNDHRLTATGAYVANLKDYGFNDLITSYLCYN